MPGGGAGGSGGGRGTRGDRVPNDFLYPSCHFNINLSNVERIVNAIPISLMTLMLHRFGNSAFKEEAEAEGGQERRS